MPGTWTHIAARQLVKPFIGTALRPNHLTTLRLLTGLGACICVALGTRSGAIWGGSLWLVSAFLDRADGELARIGNMMSEAGHTYDYNVDLIVNSFLFVGAGIGLRHGWLGPWAIPLGATATAAMLVCWIAGEAYQQLAGMGQKAFSGRWGFDMDDALYLLAPLIWLNLMSFVVVGAATVTSIMAALTLLKVRRLKARQVSLV